MANECKRAREPRLIMLGIGLLLGELFSVLFVGKGVCEANIEYAATVGLATSTPS